MCRVRCACRRAILNNLAATRIPQMAVPIPRGGAGARWAARGFAAAPVASAVRPERRVLIPAKALLPIGGVREMHRKREVDHLRLVFDHHEMIIANGVPTERAMTGPMAFRSFERV